MTNQVQAVQQHTPGPWLAREYVSGNWEVADDLSGAKVASVAGGANARLIAAAPEMLKALKETLRALEQHLSDEAADHNMKHVSALCACWENEVQRARAAIARATHG